MFIETRLERSPKPVYGRKTKRFAPNGASRVILLSGAINIAPLRGLAKHCFPTRYHAAGRLGVASLFGYYPILLQIAVPTCSVESCPPRSRVVSS